MNLSKEVQYGREMQDKLKWSALVHVGRGTRGDRHVRENLSEDARSVRTAR